MTNLKQILARKAQSHFRRIVKTRKKKGYTMDQFCMRCGRVFGENNLYQKGIKYNKYTLCVSCYKDKIDGFVSTPDIEDIAKYNINLNV